MWSPTRTLTFVLAFVSGVMPVASSSQPAAAPPATDIYLLSLNGGLDSLKEAKPSPVSVAPGYDNQPMFSVSAERDA